MGRYHDVRFPGESDEYREARDELLRAEMELRRRIEDVASLRRELPPGGRLKENYQFEEGDRDLSKDGDVAVTSFSALFEPGKDTLAIYSFMYPPQGRPCPMCTAFLDSLDGNARHLAEKVNLAVVARAPVHKIRKWAGARGWRRLRLLSSQGNHYNADYHAESADGSQRPVINVFVKKDDAIHHRYCSEMFFAPAEAGQHPRHMDLLWPLWNVLDLTPDGRGTDWFPTQSFEQSLAECGES